MKYYSEEVPVILDYQGRLEIARQIDGVLKNILDNPKKLKCLDVGCSSGVISYYLSDKFREVIGVDIDEKAIKYAVKNFQKKNLKYLKMDGEDLDFKDQVFDVVICHQVYNFVENPQKLMNEIHRVLKKGGVCYFSGRNKYAIMEPQYKIPFLSWIPPYLAKYVVKTSGRGSDFFGKNYMSYTELCKLLSIFKIEDLTIKIIKDPDKYCFKKLERFKLVASLLPKSIVSLIPNYIFILKK